MKLSLVCSGLLLSSIAFIGCNNTTSNDTKQPVADTTITETVNSITITPFNQESPAFEDASLKIKSIDVEKLGTDSAKVTLQFNVQNYELKAQTADATTKGCNNSKDGQHIHFILNNEPYVALYEPKHTFNVALNKEYFLMNFLSRSYHESVKNKGAYQLLHFSVDNNGKLIKLEIPSTPMVFFSRPKGDYVGKENTDKVLLDFYLVNSDLSNSKVKVAINGQEFAIDKWQPYFIENAPMGPLDINLQLTNNEGIQLEGPNTSVSRTATLAASEPVR